MKPDLFAKDIIYDEEARDKITQGIQIMYEVARAAYGPKAGNVLYEHNWPIGAAKLSRDGVTNLKKVTIRDRAANIAAKAVLQASEKNNAVAGDGTTAVALLTYHLYMAGRKLIGNGYNQMEVARMIDETAEKALEYIDSVKQPLTNEDLLAVAKVSSGDDGIAELLANIVQEVGEGGVTVEEHFGLGVYGEVIEGFYMRKGFTDARLVKDFGALSSDFEKVPIFLSDRVITDAKEMAQIVAKIKNHGHKELLILGEVTHGALEYLVTERNSPNGLLSTLAGIPATAGMKSIVLEDVALLTGGRVYGQGENVSNFSIDHLGAAGRVVVEELSTTIMDGAGEAKAIKARISELERQLDDERASITVNVLKDRIARLKGKIGIVKVGAPTDIDREELRLRIDDAVCALQAAKREGTVPGGGTTLARVTGTPFDDALQKLFIELMHNAGEKAEFKLAKVLEKEIGYGYDLKNITDEPIDLREAGIVDPALVIKEVVRNAASVASRLITTTVLITFSDESDKEMKGLMQQR